MNHFRQKGFTLLEVLIAVTITAIIGVGASQLLSGGAATKQGLEQRSIEIKNLQRLDLLMRKDFSQISGRRSKNTFGELMLEVSNQGDFLIEFTHSGVPPEHFNPDKKQSNMLRAGYKLYPINSPECESTEHINSNKFNDEIHCLARIFWPVLDASSNTEPTIQVLVDRVLTANFKFRGLLLDLDNDANSIRSNDWQDDWPPLGARENMVADLVQIKFKITTQSYGDIERIFEVPRYALQ